MSGWAQVGVTAVLSLAVAVLLVWTLRRAWMADEYQGARRRPWALQADQCDGGTGEYGVIRPRGRHRKEGGPAEDTRALDLTGVRAARARVVNGKRPSWLR